MRISGLHIENWRNFSNVEVPLQSRCFLIGPNASGKSNLLDSMRFLRDIASDGLDKAVEKRGGISKIRSLSARRQNKIRIECELLDGQGASWTYRLEVSGPRNKPPAVSSETVKKDGKTLLGRPDGKDKKDDVLLRQTHLEQLSMNGAFRQVADAFKSIRYLHVVPQLIRGQDRVIGKIDDPYGSAFLEHIWRENERTRKSRLNSIEKAIKCAVPQFENLKTEKDDMGVPHLYFQYKHWRPKGAWQNESDLSDGTVRLIGLLWALLDGKGPLLLEEPELSLHTEIVRSLPGIISRIRRKNPRQVIISTHSHELLSSKSIGADEILVLQPSPEGTTVRTGGDIETVRELMEAGLSAGEAALPETVAPEFRQLGLFDL